MSLRFFAYFWIILFLSLSSITFAEPPIEVIYWKASDVKMPTPEKIDQLRQVMIEVQDFFAAEMDRHGFGKKTFKFNEDIEIIKGEKKISEYNPFPIDINETSLIEYGLDNQIYVVFVGGAETFIGSNGLAKGLCRTVPENLKYCNHLVLIPAEDDLYFTPVVAHEIGHAFGLAHSLKRFILNSNSVDIMYQTQIVTRGIKDELKNYALNREDATFLNENGRLSIQKAYQDGSQGINADVNGDGYIDLYDVMIVRSGMQNPTTYDTDINNDGVTDENDLALVKLKAMEAIIAASPSKPRFKLTTTWGTLKIQ